MKISELLMGVLSSADPYTIRDGTGRTNRRAAVLDASAAQVQTELTDQPELQAQMLTVDGTDLSRLAAYDTAQATARTGAR